MPWGACTNAKISGKSSFLLNPRRRKKSQSPMLSREIKWKIQNPLPMRRKKKPQRKLRQRWIEQESSSTSSASFPIICQKPEREDEKNKTTGILWLCQYLHMLHFVVQYVCCAVSVLKPLCNNIRGIMYSDYRWHDPWQQVNNSSNCTFEFKLNL